MVKAKHGPIWGSMGAAPPVGFSIDHRPLTRCFALPLVSRAKPREADDIFIMKPVELSVDDSVIW